ncbi:MAG: hypothetical protein K8H88_18390 [Sandaracinaceae bacterium]|nr:hypothetical protein [Sandaracinaceae bacterium]
MKIYVADVVVELPPDWEVIEGAGRGVAVRVPPGSAFDGRPEDWPYGVVTLCAFECSEADRDPEFRTFADELFARRVRQGVPDQVIRSLGHVTVLEIKWTDGVSDITTWLFRSHAGACVQLEHSVDARAAATAFASEGTGSGHEPEPWRLLEP